MQQQLAVAQGLVVVAVAAGPRGDVHADQPGLASLDAGVGVLQVEVAVAHRLDLGAGQVDARLERVLDGVVRWRALRLVATVLPICGLLGSRWGGGARAPKGRTDRRTPAQKGRRPRGIHHPVGSTSAEPPRRCSYLNDYPLHTTSFRSRERYPTCQGGQAPSSRSPRRRRSLRAEPGALAEVGRLRRRTVARPGAGHGARHRVIEQQRDGLLQLVVGRRVSVGVAGPVALPGAPTGTSGMRPTPSIQVLSRVSHLATERRKPPLSPGNSVHSWTVPLPKVRSPTSSGTAGVLQRPAEDLAGRGGAAVDQHHDLERRVDGQPAFDDVDRDLRRPSASSSQKTAPSARNWLLIWTVASTKPPGSSRTSTMSLSMPGVEVGRQAPPRSPRPTLALKLSMAEVADLAIGEHQAVDVLG